MIVTMQKALERIKRCVKKIPFDRDMGALSYDYLQLGRKVNVVEPATYVDTTFCERSILEQLMGVKVSAGSLVVVQIC